VHRGFPFALVDEADSLLIDEARVPLVIAGAEAGRTTAAAEAAAVVANLTPGVHFDTDEYARDVELTDAGIEHIERVLACSLHDPRHIDRLARVNCALHARALLHRDVDYIVRHGRIELVDDWTGRVVHDRHWPDGLQSALEAKEGLAPRENGRALGSITIQRFLRGYSHLCGMTGTAQDGAEELRATYGTPVVVIPTHRPMRRRDQSDLVFVTREAKERAVVSEIHAAHASGRPVLVGTRTVAESERLAAELTATGVPCHVLNARHDADEARIVAGAGAVGAVTIATNMAGRGTDIRLGGADEADHARVAALGGLYVIGTNRHESRRIDRQLRGRAGRQGDPGESRFFISLEDDLLVRYGIDRLLSRRVPPSPPGQPLSHPIVGQEIARAQRIIEGQDFEIRRTLARYASLVEDQYEAFCARRHDILHGEAPGVWPHDDPRRAAIVGAAGEAAAAAAERTIALAHMDRLWSEHLAFCADCREGIHLVRLGGQDPLTRYVSEVMRAFRALDEAIELAVLSSLDRVRAPGGMIDLSTAGITAPTATWTYLVNDDPFRDQMGLQLMGPGGRTASVYAAALLMPLLIAWGAVDRWRRRAARRAPPPT
jgi:preprotein translocase subunit SecA